MRERMLKPLLLVMCAAATAGMQSAPKGDINVTITDLRSTEGVVRACLTRDRDTFPRCDKDPHARHLIVDAGGDLALRFTGVEPGAYAIAVLHDENDNGKADRVLGMMPKEGFGFSRDARVRMGPPKYEDAVFDFGGTEANLTIRMRYML